jgi:hypothetical protein
VLSPPLIFSLPFFHSVRRCASSPPGGRFFYYYYPFSVAVPLVGEEEAMNCLQNLLK